MITSPFRARFAPHDGELSADKLSWYGLHGSSRAIALHCAAQANTGITLVVTRSSHQAQVLARDLELLAIRPQPVLLFPDHETLPYDAFSPHPDIISERLAALSALSGMQQGLVLVSISALAQRLPPVSYMLQRSFDLHPGQSLVIETFRQRLVHAGYEAAEQVYQSGQFAIRGSVIDLFPAGRPAPIRLDLFDEEIDSIREFDPDSQRSSGPLEKVTMLPAREYPMAAADLDEFRRAFRLRFDVDTRQVRLYQDLRAGMHPQGLEQYLPLFYSQTSSFLDYRPAPMNLVLQAGALQAAADLFRRTRERWEQRRHDIEHPVLDPEELFFTPDELAQQLSRLTGIVLQEDAVVPSAGMAFNASAAPDVHIHERGKEAAADLKGFIAGFAGQVLFSADTPGRREVLSSTLAAFGIKAPVYEDFAAFHASAAHLGLVVLPVEEGFVIPGELALLTESQLFGGRTRQKNRRESTERDPESIIRSLADMAEGAPVVHEDHGVGRYLGLQTLEIDQRPAEFLVLEYADGDKLYVPVSYLHLVSRYTGSDPDSAPLHRLGSKQWDKARNKAAEKIRDVAAELLDLYSRRLARDGFAFPLDEKLYAEFAAGFPFEETPDQQNAIDAVKRDLASGKAMDRVVCGDVGFGKTEVALRAAFVAVQAGRQVALLVPTTLLAQQHLSTFSDRLADWPVRVELLSRFHSSAENKAVLERLKSGAADIVIGTHRLIQKDVVFHNLGLVIIDEEHRFGVQQKERLKQLRSEVDFLTLTATPIPRTLNMAMSGLRDLSIIATPPARRMAVKTLITRWDSAVIREALYRELQRGGQVFFLHNEVRSIERMAREVQELAPSARLAIAHGQLAEKELESVMLDFYRQRYNVLVCSTIIESGIDVPTANTIIINRADRFGLAQLHQLRGRVGRSHHRAYAYLVVPDQRSMTTDARKRLEAVAALEELGAGFTLATHDLEIRGAGELLGAEQSGQIQEIGFSLYSDMLARAVAALRDGKEPGSDLSLHRGAELDLHLPALIPETWLADVPTRLMLYKRIASARDAAALRELQVEMIDRFGLLPQPVKNLFAVAELRQLAERIGIARLDAGPQGGRLVFSADTCADPAAVIRLIQLQPQLYRMDGPHTLRIHGLAEDAIQRLAAARELLQQLHPDG
ncbi:MAG TPA: transcription-repair coupling factor [Xanthomonadales bacterium]|nr:transcription-repair coupling factor [Xanthomonadales bacterium]